MPDASPSTPAAVIPGMGVCKYCDATSVPRGCFGAEIDGDKCLGCGAPIYAILERKKPDAATGAGVMDPNCRHEFQCDGWTVDPFTSVCRVCKRQFVFWSEPAWSLHTWTQAPGPKHD